MVAWLARKVLASSLVGGISAPGGYFRVSIDSLISEAMLRNFINLLYI
jgi:hypothetical protein